VKVPPSRVEAFLKRPDPAVRAVLLYGPDGGLVRERADALAAGVVADPADPFRIVEFAADVLRKDPARLADEAAALPFGGGRKVVRVREAADGAAEAFRAFLADPAGEALVVVEGGELAARSSLRRAFEESPAGAAIGCYGDEAGKLAQVIRETLAAHGLKATAEAMAFLQENLGADRLVTRGELEKLALYMGEPGTVGLEAAAACVGDSGAFSLDAVALAAAGGNQADLDRALERAFMEGVAPVAVVRACARHFQRLHLVAGQAAAGVPLEQAMERLRPPVIFRHADRFRAQVRRWTGPRVAAALEQLIEAELACKTTGLPAETVCRRALMRLAQGAA
jgi:DNA polymerase-3 subunit delta